MRIHPIITTAMDHTSVRYPGVKAVAGTPSQGSHRAVFLHVPARDTPLAFVNLKGSVR